MADTVDKSKRGAFLPPGQPFVSETQPPNVTFATHAIAPPSQLYIGRDDRLQLALNTGGAGIVSVSGSLLRFDGVVVPLQFSSLTSGTFNFDLAEGFLLGLTLSLSSGVAIRGTSYCTATIIRGSGSAFSYPRLLVAGYLSSLCPLSWPACVPEAPTHGAGWLHSVQVSNPAAGADFALIVPLGRRWRVQGMRAALATDANVATRTVAFVIDDGTNIFHSIYSTGTQAASLSTPYCFGPYGVPSDSVNGAPHLYAPIGLVLPAGFRIRTITGSLQVGDQWSAIWAAVEEWMDY